MPGSGEDAGTTTAPPAGEPPVIFDAPSVFARGGRMYLLTDTLPRFLLLDIDGVPIAEPESVLQGDTAGALYRLPDDLPLGNATLYVRLDNDPTAVAEHPIRIEDRRFVDIAQAAGLGLVHDATGSPVECAESHTGMGSADFDNDGWPDLLIGNLAGDSSAMRNLGLGADGLPHFEDITAAVGLSGLDQVTMVEFTDLDGDGDADAFVGRRGENRVLDNRLIPDGDARFVDITDALGLGVYSQRTMGVAFGDYDGDNDLDLYVVNHAYCFPAADSEVRAGDHLYENVDGVFVERTEQITGQATGSVGFSASWVDIDRDADLDLVIINDDVAGSIGWPNALWRNDGPTPEGGWSFVDISSASGVGIQGNNGMGLALADVNLDGNVDMAFSNIGPNKLLFGDGAGGFSDVSEAVGVGRGRLPWGSNSITWASHLLDYDNDGDLDLYFSAGRIKGTALIPDALLDNDGGQFTDRTWTSGMAHPGHGKASMLVDLDRDGAWDIITSAWGEPLSVYHNRAASPSAHWLAVELQGRGRNREAIGAIVELTAGGVTQTCFHTNRPSLGAGGDKTCHFGLGGVSSVDALDITWPDTTSQSLDVTAVDQRIVAVHPGA